MSLFSLLFCFDEKNYSFLEEIRFYCPLVLVKNGFEKMVGVIFGCKQEHHYHIHIFFCVGRYISNEVLFHNSVVIVFVK